MSNCKIEKIENKLQAFLFTREIKILFLSETYFTTILYSCFFCKRQSIECSIRISLWSRLSSDENFWRLIESILGCADENFIVFRSPLKYNINPENNKVKQGTWHEKHYFLLVNLAIKIFLIHKKDLINKTHKKYYEWVCNNI